MNARARIAIATAIAAMAVFVPGASSASAEVTVDLAGAGQGTVSADRPGLDCSNVGGGPPGPSCSAAFPIMVTDDGFESWIPIQLTATPASGSFFAGWSGSDELGGIFGPSCTEGNVNPCLFIDATQEGFSAPHIIATFEPAIPPLVAIDPPGPVDEDSAHFSGSVNPQGQPVTTCRFDYISLTLFNQNLSEGKAGFAPEAPGVPGAKRVPCDTDPGEGEAAVSVQAEVEGLEPHTAYMVRLFASGLGSSAATESFITAAVPPSVTTTGAGQVQSTQAILNGRINPHGSQTTYWFEWGAEDCSTHACAALPLSKDASAGSGGKSILVSQRIFSGLQPSTTYHLRLVGESAAGTVEGDDKTFTTPAAPSPCANGGAPGTGFLPDCRAWEMVSPQDKKGANVGAYTSRTRVSTDGNAASFISLGAFADALGTGVTTDYVAKRSSDPDPGNQGWVSHAITPPEESNTFEGILDGRDPLYPGEFSADLSKGVYLTNAQLSDDPAVAAVQDLYLRTDLGTPGPGTYQLQSACPLCAEPGGSALPAPTTRGESLAQRPVLLGASPDFDRVVFESKQRLTADTPLDSNPGQRARLYESHQGEVSLVGRIPTSGAECDDDGGPACEAADISIGGQGAGTMNGSSSLAQVREAHAVSDESDGHSRIFFTRPTDDGVTVNPGGSKGNLYMRVDGHETIQINASERTSPAGFAPAAFWDASADGSRAFFTSNEPLTDDAPSNETKLYMYEAAPDSEGNHLTLLSVDSEAADGIANVLGVAGVDTQGDYVYFAALSQLVKGAPAGRRENYLYLWHDGDLTYIAPLAGGTVDLEELLSSGTDAAAGPFKPIVAGRQARVTPDGRHLLFGTFGGTGLLSQHGGTDYDQNGHRELYVYDAETDELQCASCNPSGAPATSDASTASRTLASGAQQTTHQTNALSADGRYAFFSTREALVPEDTNGPCSEGNNSGANKDCVDAYVYDTVKHEARLLSSGKSDSGAIFMDASPDGKDAFFVTAEQLSAWDTDGSYDLYDARVGGGFPEPTPAAPGCGGEACQAAPASNTAPSSSAPSSLSGPANPKAQRQAKKKHKKHKKKAHKKTKQQKRAANDKRRAGR